MAQDVEHFLLIQLADQKMALRLENITEIVPNMALATDPEVGDHYRGILNLRGEMIPVFDRAPSEGDAVARMIVVLRNQEDPMGLMVDDLVDIVALPAERVSTRSVGRGRTATFARLDDGVLRVLDPAEVAA